MQIPVILRGPSINYTALNFVGKWFGLLMAPIQWFMDGPNGLFKKHVDKILDFYDTHPFLLQYLNYYFPRDICLSIQFSTENILHSESVNKIVFTYASEVTRVISIPKTSLSTWGSLIWLSNKNLVKLVASKR